MSTRDSTGRFRRAAGQESQPPAPPSARPETDIKAPLREWRARKSVAEHTRERFGGKSVGEYMRDLKRGPIPAMRPRRS